MTAAESPVSAALSGKDDVAVAGVGTVVTDVDSVTTRTAKRRDDWKRSRCWTLTAQGSAVLAVPPELPADRYTITGYAPIVSSVPGLVGDQQ